MNVSVHLVVTLLKLDCETSSRVPTLDCRLKNLAFLGPEPHTESERVPERSVPDDVTRNRVQLLIWLRIDVRCVFDVRLFFGATRGEHEAHTNPPGCRDHGLHRVRGVRGLGKSGLRQVRR